MSTFNINFSSFAFSTGSRPVVVLSIHNAGERKLIQKVLPAELLIEPSVRSLSTRKYFDLCIMDQQSFNINKGKLQNLKERAAPIFLPFLLLTQNQNLVQKNPEVLEFADDIVYIPASLKLLESRIKLMLKQREYSLKLEEKNRQLEQKNRELEEEKKKYQLIAENSTDIISRHTPDGTYLYASEASRDLIGYEPDELVDQNAYDNIHPDDRNRMQNKISKFENPVERTVYRKKVKSGSYKWVESTIRPIRDQATGEIIEIQASTRDISERKEFEQKLKDEKEFINTVVESLPGIFFMLDANRNFVKWNDNFNKVLGYHDREIKKMKPVDFFEEKEHGKIKSKIKEVFREGLADIEIDIKSKDGELISHYLIGRKLTRNKGSYLIGTGINITERLKAEQKLRESEKRWEQLVENNPSLVQLTTKDNSIKYINPAGATLYGADDPSEIVGKSFIDFVSATSKDHLEKRINNILAGKSVNPVVYEAVTKDGKEKFVELDNVMVKHDDEQVVLTVAKDNTEQFEYEQKLKQSIQEKKTLLQEIHHRVKNNLAVVSGMLQLQAFDTENREVKKFLNDSENRIKTMALIHEQLYKSNSLSKIDFGLYARQLINNIKEVSENRKVDLELEHDSFHLNVNQAVPCALILNEIISNSYGTFEDKEKKSIKVQLKEKNERIFVQIRNDDLYFSRNFEQKDESSMGLTIIETLIKQLESKLNIQDENGLVFSFSFTKQEIRGSTSGII